MSQLSSSSPATSSPARSEDVVNPEPDSRLDQLTAEYAQLLEKVERFDEIKAAIKMELAKLVTPEATSILLSSPHLAKPLRLKYVPGGWQIDTKAIKAAVPETVWMPWAKQKQGYWELRAAR